MGLWSSSPDTSWKNTTAVPLPAAAWLMLSGLAALGAVARRRISAATRASNLQAPGVKFAGSGRQNCRRRPTSGS